MTYKKTHVGRGDGLDRFASSMFIVANLVSILSSQMNNTFILIVFVYDYIFVYLFIYFKKYQ